MARQDSAEERAYCAQLAGLYGRYHFNLFHLDGTWAPAELAKVDCAHGNADRGIQQLEHILRSDRFVLHPPASISAAAR
jgi:hypothetical protein